MFRSIRARLTATIIGLAVFPLIVLGIFLSFRAYTVMKTHALELQDETAQRVGGRVEAFINRLENELHIVSSLQGVHKLPLAEQRKLLSELLSYENLFEEITLLDAKGFERVRLHHLEIVTPDMLTSRADSTEFRIPTNTLKNYFSPIRMSVESGEQFMKLAIPLHDFPSRTAKGVLIGDIRMEKIWDLLAATDTRPGEMIYILDNKNAVVAHQNPSIVLRGTYFSLPEDLSSTVPGLFGNRAVIGHTHLQFGDQIFTVVAERKATNAFEFALNTMKLFITAVVLTALFASTALLATLWRIITPLTSLSQTALAIEQGDLSQRAPVTGNDELAELAQSFNRMTSRLQGLMAGLEREVQEKTKIENSLRISEERLNYAMSAANDGIWEYFPKTDTVYYSPVWYTMLGYQPNELPQTFATFTHLLHEEDQYILAAFKEYLDLKRPTFLVEFRMLCKDGSYKWIHSRGKGVETEYGRIVRVVGTHTDITIRKQTEALLREKTIELENINRRLAEKVHEETSKRLTQERLMMQQSKLAAMGEMVGSIAHQWRQPLNAVGLLVQDIAESYEMNTLSADALMETSRLVMTQLRHMSETIDDFRNFFKRDKQQETFCVYQSVREVLNLTRAQLESHALSTVISINGETVTEDSVNLDTGCKVKGYRNEFKHVILNLINNAKDAYSVMDSADEQIISIDIRCKDGNVFLCISDQAGGIPDDIADRVFEPYFTTKLDSKGVGIGLYMSKTIVENNMNGTITFSNKNGGAEFCLTLPEASAE